MRLREKMPNNTDYPTKPIASWVRMEELMQLYARQNREAHQRGEPVIFGGLGQAYLAMLAGLGSFVYARYGPHFDAMMRDHRQNMGLLEVIDGKGYSRDICSLSRCHLSQILTGKAATGVQGEPVKPDLIFQILLCKSLEGKTAQIAGEKLGVPCCFIDHPNVDTTGTREYFLHQLLDAIEWFEKTTGRRYDDEKLFEALPIEWDSAVMWARICDLNKNIPAPLHARHLQALRNPVFYMRHRRKCLDYLNDLYDEVKGRVADGISACGFEKRRLIHEGIPPNYWMDEILSMPDRYGALYVMADSPCLIFGAWESLQNGSLVPAPLFREKQFKIKTREDALRAEIDLFLSYHIPGTCLLYSVDRPRQFARRALDWHADGVVFHIDRTCHLDSAGVVDRKAEVQKAGVPAMSYESSAGDARELAEAQILDRFDSFMEALGLRPLATGSDVTQPHQQASPNSRG